MDPIRTTIFPPNVLTFHLDPHNPDDTLPLTRTEVVIRDAASTLLTLQSHFRSLDPKEQRNYLIALLVEKM